MRTRVSRLARRGALLTAIVLTAPGSGGVLNAAAPGPDGSIGGLRAKYVDVKGVKTRYYDEGQGVPMVLIHGGMTAGSSTANVFSRNIPGLAKRFRVLAVDRLGSGLTGNPLKDEDYATPGQVEHIYQFIQAMKLGAVHLVGHSAGGAVAFYLAVHHPEIARTLTIIGQGPENPPAAEGPTRLDLSQCPDQNVYEGLKCRVEKLAWLPTSFDPEYWEADATMAMQPKSKEARAKVVALSNDAFRAAGSAYRQKAWDTVRNSGVLQMPVMLVAGKQDVLDWGQADPTAQLRGELGLFDIIGAKNSKVKMVVFNQAGHFPYREYPEQFNADLVGFIDHYDRARSAAPSPAAPQTAAPNGSIAGLQARFIDVQGVKTRYYEAGQGEPMVLIHGGSTAGSSTANVWSRNLPGLAKRFHVYAVDRLGSGLTGNPLRDADYSTEGQVEHVYRFIQTLGLGKIHLVGHSAGGAAAFYLATLHPEIIRTLSIVAHGPANPRVDTRPNRLAPRLEKCPDQNVYEGLKCRVEALAWLPTCFDSEYWAADQFMAKQPKSIEARAKVVALSNDAWRAMNDAFRQKAWDRVRNDGVLTMPVLMYGGKQDVLDWAQADGAASLAGELALFDMIGAKHPKVSMVVANEGGHFMYREHPEQFNADLIGFIDFWNGRK